MNGWVLYCALVSVGAFVYGGAIRSAKDEGAIWFYSIGCGFGALAAVFYS